MPQILRGRGAGGTKLADPTGLYGTGGDGGVGSGHLARLKLRDSGGGDRAKAHGISDPP
ncbi:MAG: hypothetical protein RQ750_10275 [Roseovarius sp.]|nr:hypothetical protein [Roseovarius sp.]